MRLCIKNGIIKRRLHGFSCEQESMARMFGELKKKYLTLAIIKSVVAGVFLALFAVGAVMLGIKLGAVKLDWYFYLVIALGVFGVAFGVTFTLTRRSDKSLAKMLDNEYALNEKVQTMVEFEGQDGDILNLQREDAENVLANLPKKKISFAKIWQYVVIVALGVSFILAGTIVPSRYVAPASPDEFVLKEWDLKSLEQLIEDVKSSDLEDEVMLPAVSALELLKEDLASAKTNSAMRTAVRNCAAAIDGAVILANTYRDVALAMNSYTALDDFKKSIVYACDSYKGESALNSITEVKAAQKLSEGKIREKLGVFTNAFVSKIKGYSAKVEIRDAVDAFLTPLNESMADEKVAEKLQNDALYIALSNFSTPLGTVLDEYLWRDDLDTIVSSACTDFVTAASSELVVQVYNAMMDEMIMNTLSNIFDVALAPEELDLPGISGGGSESEDSPWHGGGTGDTETIYGGNDAVYDHNTVSHVPYGQVWNSYVSKLYEKLNDKESGLSEEMKAYIQNYISILEGSASGSDGGED